MTSLLLRSNPPIQSNNDIRVIFSAYRKESASYVEGKNKAYMCIYSGWMSRWFNGWMNRWDRFISWRHKQNHIDSFIYHLLWLYIYICIYVPSNRYYVYEAMEIQILTRHEWFMSSGSLQWCLIHKKICRYPSTMAECVCA